MRAWEGGRRLVRYRDITFRWFSSRTVRGPQHFCSWDMYGRTLLFVRRCGNSHLTAVATYGDAVVVVEWYVRTDEWDRNAGSARTVYRPYTLFGQEQLDLAIRRGNGAPGSHRRDIPSQRRIMHPAPG